MGLCPGDGPEDGRGEGGEAFWPAINAPADGAVEAVTGDTKLAVVVRESDDGLGLPAGLAAPARARGVMAGEGLRGFCRRRRGPRRPATALPSGRASIGVVPGGPAATWRRQRMSGTDDGDCAPLDHPGLCALPCDPGDRELCALGELLLVVQLCPSCRAGGLRCIRSLRLGFCAPSTTSPPPASSPSSHASNDGERHSCVGERRSTLREGVWGQRLRGTGRPCVTGSIGCVQPVLAYVDGCEGVYVLAPPCVELEPVPVACVEGCEASDLGSVLCVGEETIAMRISAAAAAATVTTNSGIIQYVRGGGSSSILIVPSIFVPSIS